MNRSYCDNKEYKQLINFNHIITWSGCHCCDFTCESDCGLDIKDSIGASDYYYNQIASNCKLLEDKYGGSSDFFYKTYSLAFTKNYCQNIISSSEYLWTDNKKPKDHIRAPDKAVTIFDKMKDADYNTYVKCPHCKEHYCRRCYAKQSYCNKCGLHLFFDKAIYNFLNQSLDCVDVSDYNKYYDKDMIVDKGILHSDTMYYYCKISDINYCSICSIIYCRECYYNGCPFGCQSD
jgi:hypothetical protein